MTLAHHRFLHFALNHYSPVGGNERDPGMLSNLSDVRSSRPERAEAPARVNQGLGVHLPELDGFRGLAILMVMFYHFGHCLDGPIWTGGFVGKLVARAVASGWCGVDLFFVLSGFLITGILYDTKGHAGFFRTFYMRRVLRIFPLYYGVLVAAFFVSPWVGATRFGLWAPPENQGWFWLYGVNFLRVFRGHESCGTLEHLWSLAVEEHFYLFWPLLIFLLNRVAAMWACVAVAAGALWFRLAGVYLGYQTANYMLTPARVDAMAVGAFLALAVRGPGGLGSVVRHARSAAAISGFLLAALLATHHGVLYCFAKDTQTVGYTLLAVFFGSTMVLTVASGGRGLASRLTRNHALGFIGKYSYGIYVFHFSLVPALVGLLGLDRALRNVGPQPMAVVAHLLILMAVSVAVAWLSWHLYEKHFLRLKKLFPY